MASKLAARIFTHDPKRARGTAGPETPDLRSTLPDREPDGTLTVLLSINDGRQTAEAPFTVADLRAWWADLSATIERAEAREPFRTEHNLSDHRLAQHGAVDDETECSGCGLEVKSWRASPDCAFYDEQTDPDAWPLFDPTTCTFPDHPEAGPDNVAGMVCEKHPLLPLLTMDSGRLRLARAAMGPGQPDPVHRHSDASGAADVACWGPLRRA